MVKKLLIATIISVFIFSLVSYISVMVSLLQSAGDPSMKPVTNIGFPFNYYYQFWLSGSDRPNCGWILRNFVYDAVIVWVAVVLVYLYWAKNRR